MENQNNRQDISTQNHDVLNEKFFNSESDEKVKKGLENDLKKLNYLCHHYDPFSGPELSTELSSIIDEYELRDYLADPFTFTNKLLQIMDKVENQIKKQIH